jgi:hypothetical protein
MSYDISLHDAETGAELEHTDPTYNYGAVWGSLVFDLNGKTAADTVPALREFCCEHAYAFGSGDHGWDPTPGNAMLVVPRLLIWALKYPAAIWRVT